MERLNVSQARSLRREYIKRFPALEKWRRDMEWRKFQAEAEYRGRHPSCDIDEVQADAFKVRAYAREYGAEVVTQCEAVNGLFVSRGFERKNSL
jgi:hypothetical protein